MAPVVILVVGSNLVVYVNSSRDFEKPENKDKTNKHIQLSNFC